MKTKNINLITTIISITLILSSFLGSVHFYCFNESFYTKQHEKIMLYGKHINEHIGISNEQLKELTSFTLNYLNDPHASLDIQMEVKGQLREVYTDDEKLHMEDVRTLNLIANYTLIISTAIMVFLIGMYIYRKYRISYLFLKFRSILKVFSIFLLCLGAWILIDFNSFWTLFHHIFFAGNDLWLLDLRKDILIMIVPPEFFNNLVTRIIVCFALLLITIYFVLRYLSRKKEFND